MDFSKIWEVMEYSFPPNERRPFLEQKNLLNNEFYEIDCVMEKDILCGFVCKWNIYDFLFLEHVAIANEFRGKGIGSKMISSYLKDKTVILEVELPHDTNSIRRINLYERLGFKLNEYEYYQLPLNKGDEKTKMFIMSYPNKLTPTEFDYYVKNIYKYVYNFS